MKSTTKAERRAARLAAIQWNSMAKWSLRQGRPLVFREPPPGFGIAAWARRNRMDPVPLRVSVTLPIQVRSAAE